MFSADRAVHELGFLQDESDPGVELVGGHRPDVLSANGIAPCCTS